MKIGTTETPAVAYLIGDGGFTLAGPKSCTLIVEPGPLGQAHARVKESLTFDTVKGGRCEVRLYAEKEGNALCGWKFTAQVGGTVSLGPKEEQ